jgi:hypothetical protein
MTPVAGAFEPFLVERRQAEIQARLPFKAQEARVLKKPALKTPARRNLARPQVAARKTKALKS